MNFRQKKVRKPYLRCFLIFGLLLTCFLKPDFVQASSATVGFEIEDAKFMVGDQITVTLNVNTDAILGDFEGNIVYNSAVLEYVQGPSCITGGYGMLRIEDMDVSSSWNQRSYIMTFKAIDFGECEFSFVDTPVAYEYDNGEAMSVSATSKSINVEGAPTSSSNADLSMIKLSSFILTPTFDASVTEYSVIVDSTTSQLILSAIPVDLTAKVEIDGNKDFEVGNNEVTITVTSEAGTKKQYVIHIVKQERPTVTLPVTQEDSQSSFHAFVEDGVTLICGSYEYSIVTATDNIQIPDGYVKTSIRIDGYTVPVYQLSEKVEDDYLLLVLQNQFGQTNLYRYDRLEKTIQRYTGDRVIIQENTDDAEQKITQITKSFENKLGQKNLVIVILCGFIVLLMVGLIRLYLKTKGLHDDEFY